MRRGVFFGLGIGVLMGIVSLGIVTRYAGSVRKILGNQAVEIGGQEIVFDSGKLTYMDKVISRFYIGEVNSEAMMEGIYRGYVQGLEDPYTLYLTSDEFKKEREEAIGNYIGMGIEYAWGVSNQYIVVTDVVKDSPADEADIEVGDRIVAIDGILAMASNETIIYDKLIYSGEDVITYRIKKSDGTGEREVELKPEVVEVELVHDELLPNGVGYIRLDGVVEGTVEVLRQRMEKLVREGANKWMIDLRDARSVHLEEVIRLSDVFLEGQELLRVETFEGKELTYTTHAGSYKEPVVILTNNYTRGALEAFVAAMKENKRATIVGETTQGNGTIQEPIALEDGSGLMVTTGIIKTLENEMIYGKGVVPDIVQKQTMDERLELITTGRLQKEHDRVLQEALEVFE